MKLQNEIASFLANQANDTFETLSNSVDSEVSCDVLVTRICNEMEKIPLRMQKDIKRAYEKTWSICALSRDGLVTPTDSALSRLKNLLFALLMEKNTSY